MVRRGFFAVLSALALLGSSIPAAAQSAPQSNEYLFNDSHFHLTNYVQEGTNIGDFLKIMGSKTGRVALFGIPLQQQWSYRIDGDHAPTYYLGTDAHLYYYSFTDAWIAMAYKSLPKSTAGPLRSNDHRIQPDRYVRHGPHSPGVGDVSGCILRDRGVYHSQGVCRGEDRWGCG